MPLLGLSPFVSVQECHCDQPLWKARGYTTYSHLRNIENHPLYLLFVDVFGNEFLTFLSFPSWPLRLFAGSCP